MNPNLRTRLIAATVRAWRLVRPNPLVDADFYRSTYPDVALSGLSAGRHFYRHGARELRDPNEFFDTDWYLITHPDVAASGLNPLDHYLMYGAAAGADPGPLFDTDWYASQYSDVGRQNPLVHYLRHGRASGHLPRPEGTASVPSVQTVRGPHRRPGVPWRDDKFVISCSARSGSTMLMFLLSSHPDIICHGEPYGYDDTVGYLDGRYRKIRNPSLEAPLWEYLTQDPEAFLYDVLFDHQDRKVAGFKYKIDEAFGSRRVHRQDLQQTIGRDTDIKIIRLRRRDLLAQYISHESAKRTGVHLVTDGPKPAIEPFVADPRLVLNYFTELRRREVRANDAYRDHRQFSVSYEDLIDDASPAREAMLEFLGVPATALTTPSKKLNTQGHAVMKNADEVLAELRRNGFEAEIGAV